MSRLKYDGRVLDTDVFHMAEQWFARELLDSQYCFWDKPPSGDGSDQLHWFGHGGSIPDEHDKEPVYINATRWVKDLLHELNQYAKGQYYPVEGHFAFSQDKPSLNIANGKCVAYYVHGEEVAWIHQGEYSKKLRRDHPCVTYSYSPTYRMTKRMEYLAHGSLALGDYHGQLFRDVGSDPKKVAKEVLKKLVYPWRKRLARAAVDQLIRKEHAEDRRRIIEAAGFTMGASTSDIGTYSMSGFIANAEIMHIQLNEELITLWDHETDGHMIQGANPVAPGAIDSCWGKVRIKLHCMRNHVSSFMQQFPLALGPKYLDMVDKCDFDFNSYRYEHNKERTPIGDGAYCEIDMQLTIKNLRDLISVTESIRRTDTWRACWAAILADKLKKSA